MRYCEEEDLVFTRSRPYAKNDGCFVEEKNWPVSCRVVGSGRYEGQAACDLDNEIYDRQRILANYFMLSAKLVGRMRDGSRVVCFHDKPLTPYPIKGVGKDACDSMRAEFKAARMLKLSMEMRDHMQRLMKMSVALIRERRGRFGSATSNHEETNTPWVTKNARQLLVFYFIIDSVIFI